MIINFVKNCNLKYIWNKSTCIHTRLSGIGWSEQNLSLLHHLFELEKFSWDKGDRAWGEILG